MRTTRRALRSLVGASVILIVVAVLVWIFAPFEKLAHAQTFNGALVIPGFGGLWIASFMFIWLIPMREVSFRGQESAERMEGKLRSTIDEKLIPALETWQRVGDRFENVVIPNLEQAIQTTERVALLVEGKAAPAIDIARRIEANIEAELTTGILQDLRTAAQSVNLIVMSKEGVPPSPTNIARTLDTLNKPSKVTRGGTS